MFPPYQLLFLVDLHNMQRAGLPQHLLIVVKRSKKPVKSL